jgi:NADH:ubiquinone oxidoreductase subunit E
MEAVAEQAKASSTKKDTVKITVCKSLSAIAEGAEEVYKEFEKQIEENHAAAEIME